MERSDLQRFPTDTALALAAADGWLDLVLQFRQAGRRLSVALSGGRIARRFFETTVERAQARKISLASVKFFWADERCVPPAHAESNFALADRHLFRPLGITAMQVHRIQGELAPADAARTAEIDLRRFAPANTTAVPTLDVVFLGMGEDGHVASLFPGAATNELNSDSLFQAVVASKPPPERITMTYSVLAAAREVWVLISGAGKESALADSLRADGHTPLAQVIQSRGRTRLFTDLPE